jgi:hypothetical protein
MATLQSIAPSKSLKTYGSAALVIALLSGLSYCSEWPKYRFEDDARLAGTKLPGARLLGSFKTADLASPVSWFWPATTTWNYAMPDPLINGRFVLVTLVYDHDPIIFMVDVDCKARTVTWYDQDEPDNAVPAQDTWGRDVKAPNGKTYRLWKSNYPLPGDEMHTLCDTDWTREKRVVAAARGL